MLCPYRQPRQRFFCKVRVKDRLPIGVPDEVGVLHGTPAEVFVERQLTSIKPCSTHLSHHSLKEVGWDCKEVGVADQRARPPLVRQRFHLLEIENVRAHGSCDRLLCATSKRMKQISPYRRSGYLLIVHFQVVAARHEHPFAAGRAKPEGAGSRCREQGRSVVDHRLDQGRRCQTCAMLPQGEIGASSRRTLTAPLLARC